MINLRQLRKQKNLTIAAAADKLNLPFETYRSYEIGRRQPDHETLIKIADFFNVTIDYILGHDAITPEEYAAGARATRRIEIRPIEDDLLYAFRKLSPELQNIAVKTVYTLAGEDWEP